jgi:predicted RNA-binding Zn-ribbon protein involved in translation (DUF1610 family)
VPYSNVARFVSTAKGSDGKTAAARARTERLQMRTAYIFTFPNVSNAKILITNFTKLVSHIYECLNCSSCNFKINMKNNSVKYLQGISFSRLTLTETT